MTDQETCSVLTASGCIEHDPNTAFVELILTPRRSSSQNCDSISDFLKKNSQILSALKPSDDQGDQPALSTLFFVLLTKIWHKTEAIRPSAVVHRPNSQGSFAILSAAVGILEPAPLLPGRAASSAVSAVSSASTRLPTPPSAFASDMSLGGVPHFFQPK
ncbi:MAG: hypothetical protein ACKV0T_13430 [Planctomycetales bacterium]